MEESAANKQVVIFFKTPAGANGAQDEYSAVFADSKRYVPVFVSILKTTIAEAQVDALKGLLHLGACHLALDGVILTSSRAVDAFQMALDRLKQDLDRQTDTQGPAEDQQPPDSGWASIPFFVVGGATCERLRRLDTFNDPRLFPDPRQEQLVILGHEQSGSGAKLARFIKRYFSQRAPSRDPHPAQSSNPTCPIECRTGRTSVNLLYLAGNHQEPGLARELMNHDDDPQTAINFNLIKQIVYSVEPELAPRFEPREMFQDSDRPCVEDMTAEDMQEIHSKLRDEIESELEGIKRGNSHLDSCKAISEDPDHLNKLKNWVVFFSPNTSRIVLENVNDLLIQVKLRFSNLKNNPETYPRELLSDCLFKLNLMKIATIGSTTSNFLSQNLNLNPHVISSQPNPSSLLESILAFDQNCSSNS